jgi:hypothetical protein
MPVSSSVTLTRSKASQQSVTSRSYLSGPVDTLGIIIYIADISSHPDQQSIHNTIIKK